MDAAMVRASNVWDQREWLTPKETHPEPGRPSRASASTRPDAERYRDLACPHYDACNTVAALGDWPAWGCHGEEPCPRLKRPVKVIPQPGRRSVGACVDCGAKVSNKARRCKECDTERRLEQARRNPNLRCEHCGTQFQVHPYEVGRKRFCSIECTRAARRKPMVRLTCEVCGDAFELPPGKAKGRRYCSVSCSKKKDRVFKFCARCGAVMDGPPSKMARRTYCSNRCSTLAQQELRREGEAA